MNDKRQGNMHLISHMMTIEFLEQNKIQLVEAFNADWEFEEVKGLGGTI